MMATLKPKSIQTLQGNKDKSGYSTEKLVRENDRRWRKCKQRNRGSAGAVVVGGLNKNSLP